MANKLRKLIFIGPTSLTNGIECGETAKNRVLLNRLNRSHLSIIHINTKMWSRKPRVVLAVLASLFRKESVALSTSSYTAYRYIQIAFFLGVSHRITYFVIGGVLDELIAKGRFSQKYYRFLKNIYVENEQMKISLCEIGLASVCYLPNLREIPEEIADINRSYNFSKELKMVFMSRITPQKGVALLISVIKDLNRRGYDNKITLDFYGPIEETFRRDFFASIKSISNISYQGYLDLSLSENYRFLQRCDVLIFPTWWEGEGMPGAIIDAFISGLPVIASDWHHNSSLIIDNWNGILVKAKSHQSLAQGILTVVNMDRDEFVKLKRNALESAKNYDVECVMNEDLINRL